VEYVRRERKPFLLETYTYRLRGHMEPDDQWYVDPEELAMWRRRDPIVTLSRRLVDGGALTDAAVNEARDRAAGAIERAAAFAVESPYPDPAELTTDVYA
jgi:pyruvate dehydrogenase E1 component alpha subunit